MRLRARRIARARWLVLASDTGSRDRLAHVNQRTGERRREPARDALRPNVAPHAHSGVADGVPLAHARERGYAGSGCSTRTLSGYAGRGERAPGEPAPEAALEIPRAVQRQLARPHRTAELGPPKVDAVEGGGVNPDLEVDVEAGVLEADRHIGGLEHHPVALGGVAEVELDHGAVSRELLAIDVPGHPDDQEVGVELLRSGIGERPGRPPLADCLYDRLKIAAGRGEPVLERPPLGPGPSLDDLGPLERAQALGEDRARDPRQAALELIEPTRAAQHLAGSRATSCVGCASSPSR